MVEMTLCSRCGKSMWAPPPDIPGPPVCWPCRKEAREGGMVEIKCVGGMLDGETVTTGEAEQTIHQTGLAVLRLHEPYPKRKGEKITERLLTYTEDYALAMTEDGPIYRVVAPFGGVSIGDERLEPSEGGAFDVWKWADGKWHARPH